MREHKGNQNPRLQSGRINVPPEMIEQIRQIVSDAGGVLIGVQLALNKRFPEVIFDDRAGQHTLPLNPDKFDIEKFSRMVRAEVEDTTYEEKKMAKEKETPAEASRTKTLLEKLHAVYQAIEFIEKGGENTAQHYSYIKAADVTRAIRRAFIDLRVYAEIDYDFIGIPYTIARAKEPNAPFSARDCKCSAVFHDLDSPARAHGSGLGTGADMGDKAIYKAQTGALKYTLKNAFLVPDEADPEADSTVDENNNRAVPSRQVHEDVTDASHAAPEKKVGQPAKRDAPETRPTPDTPAKESTQAAQPTTSAKPAAAPSASNAAAPIATTSPASPEVQHGDAYEGPDEAGDVKPTELEMKEYRKQFKILGDELAEKGKFKASAKLPANVKLKVFLLNTMGVNQAEDATRAQWDAFFHRVRVGKDNPAMGLIGIAKLVNKANGLDENGK